MAQPIFDAESLSDNPQSFVPISEQDDEYRNS